MSGGARKNSLRTQRLARISKAGEDGLVADPGIICENVRFAPSLGHQADHEFDRQAGAPNNRLPSQYLRVKRDARRLRGYGSTAPLSPTNVA